MRKEVNNVGKVRYYSETIYVDIDTGEIMKKDQFERGNYRIIIKEKKYEYKTSERGENYGIVKHLNGIRQHEQTRLFD